MLSSRRKSHDPAHDLFDISEIEADGGLPLKAILYTASEADVTC
jgi:hypothetical protein